MTFSLVHQFETVSTLLSLAVKLSFPIYQFDFKSLFLNGDLEEEVMFPNLRDLVLVSMRAK